MIAGMVRLVLLCGVALLAASCGQTATATFPVGAEVDISADELGLPIELMAMDGTVQNLPCGPMGMCPSSPDAPGMSRSQTSTARPGSRASRIASVPS